MSLKIEPFKSDKDGIKLRPLMKESTIPAFPQSLLMVGASSSGKTTLLLRLMTQKHMYKGYHEFVFLFSVTAHLDDSFKRLKLRKDHMFSTEETMITAMEEIVQAQKENIENGGISNAPKILLIFEDLTTNTKLLKNPIFASLWTLGRHLNIQIIGMVHKYKALPRVQRLNAMCIIYFRGSADEQSHLVEDFTPPGHTKREFSDIVAYATRGEHNFLYICNRLDFKIKFRRNFDTILELSK
jgi:hypothetical protein